MTKHTDDTRTPHRVDIRVGAAIRFRRRQLSISQEQLADALGITFQQVQKYERSTNRVSASKLYAIATALQVPIGYFFEGLEDTHDPANPVAASQLTAQLISAPGGQELAETFLALPNSLRKLVNLMGQAMLKALQDAAAAGAADRAESQAASAALTLRDAA